MTLPTFDLVVATVDRTEDLAGLLDSLAAQRHTAFRVVVADQRSPRDGRFIERLGYFNPLLPKDKTERLKLDMEKVKAWLAKGALPSDTVARLFRAAGIMPAEKAEQPAKAKASKAAAK